MLGRLLGATKDWHIKLCVLQDRMEFSGKSNEVYHKSIRTLGSLYKGTGPLSLRRTFTPFHEEIFGDRAVRSDHRAFVKDRAEQGSKARDITLRNINTLARRSLDMEFCYHLWKCAKRLTMRNIMTTSPTAAR